MLSSSTTAAAKKEAKTGGNGKPGVAAGSGDLTDDALSSDAGNSQSIEGDDREFVSF